MKEAAGDKILLSKLPLDVGEKEVLCSGGSGKLITFALVVQEDYGPLERRVFDLQFSGQVSGAVVTCCFSTAWRCVGCEGEVRMMGWR